MNVAQKLVKLLAEKHLTVTTAESCTGGLVSSLITAVPGASEVLEGALVAYAPRVKHDMLNVPSEIIEEKGVVSAECAAAMAEGARALFSADCALALTGYAGPAGGDSNNPVGTVWIAAVIPTDNSDSPHNVQTHNVQTHNVQTHRFHIEGDRDAVRQGAAEAALTFLYELLSSN